MSTFSVRVVEITNVEDHPNADRLSLNTVLGYTCISNKLDDGSHRYKVGDHMIYVPEASVVPDYLLRPAYWDDEKNMGILSGSKGNRVKAIRLRQIFSVGLLFPVINDQVINESGETLSVNVGDDVAEFLGITKYEPPVPAALSGQVCNITPHTGNKYDFENLESVPDIFLYGEEVVATEKLHGTFFTSGYVPGLNHDELFFDGNLYVGSKGLSGQGLVFKNVEENSQNTYVKVLNQLLVEGFGERIKSLSEEFDCPVRVYGEIYGAGLQKGFTYGKKQHTLAIFDIKIGQEFVSYDRMLEFASNLILLTVPLLYRGPFDKTKLIEYRDGKTTVNDNHIREGLVVKAADGSRHSYHGRKIAKMVSPAYSLKASGEEFN